MNYYFYEHILFSYLIFTKLMQERSELFGPYMSQENIYNES